jgi:hypothetical protein
MATQAELRADFLRKAADQRARNPRIRVFRGGKLVTDGPRVRTSQGIVKDVVATLMPKKKAATRARFNRATVASASYSKSKLTQVSPEMAAKQVAAKRNLSRPEADKLRASYKPPKVCTIAKKPSMLQLARDAIAKTVAEKNRLAAEKAAKKTSPIMKVTDKLTSFGTKLKTMSIKGISALTIVIILIVLGSFIGLLMVLAKQKKSKTNGMKTNGYNRKSGY